MIKKVWALALLLVGGKVNAQDYWQQQVRYNINATLDDVQKTITATEKLVYINHAPTKLDFIWFHIWPNAYSNEQTALFKQLQNDEERKKKLGKYSLGNITGLAFTVNGQAAAIEKHPEHIDIIKLVLPQPLQPGDSVTIATPFTVKLPSYFSRSGFEDGEFMVCQWYPKPAVYDANGWHEMPYLDMGEFYSEYASFDVSVTLPSGYVVGATGVLQNADELAAYKQLGAANAANRDKKPQLYTPTAGTTTKTLSWHADNVLDFAWFAAKDFAISYDTIQLPSGKVADAFAYYHAKKNSLWVNAVDYIKDGVHRYSQWIGEYEYPVVQAVEGPKNSSSGGMEYPMITLITSPDAKAETLDAVIVHEVGHNWFMGMLGSNERDHAWMDEGMNTYFQFRYEAEKYRSNSMLGSLPETMKALPALEFQNFIYRAALGIPIEKPVETKSQDFATSEEYGLTVYLKAAIWAYIVEQSLQSQELLDKAFQQYFNDWKFKHPQPNDMRASFEKAVGYRLEPIFSMLNNKGAFK